MIANFVIICFCKFDIYLFIVYINDFKNVKTRTNETNVKKFEFKIKN